MPGSRISFLSLVLNYGLDDRCSIPNGAEMFFFSPPRPDRFWGSPSLLSNGYRGCFSRE